MPSRSLTAPPRQFAEPTASYTKDGREEVALPVLEEVEVRHETEYAFDLQGRKHLETDQEYRYGPQEGTSSVSYLDFAMPGLICADVLRNFLYQHLQPDQIIDENGDRCGLSEVSNNHLPMLQAKMWANVSNDPAPVRATAVRPSRVEVIIAGHVAQIVQSLEANHVFVYINFENTTCDYPNDSSRTHPCRSQKVRMEPLVHWGTITPINLSPSILTFRRDGSLMRQIAEQPGYARLVRCLVKPDAPTFCISCLEHLWSWRTEAQKPMRPMQSTVLRLHAPLSEDIHPPQRVLNPEEHALRTKHTVTYEIDNTVNQATNDTELEVDGLQKNSCDALPQLDGASDRFEKAHTGHFPDYNQGRYAIEIRSDSDTPDGSRGTPMKSPEPTTRKPDFAAENAQTAFLAVENESIPQVIHLTTPPRAKEREFGKNIDPNVKASLVPVRRSPRNHKTEKLVHKESQTQPIKRMKALKPMQRANTVNTATKVTKNRKVVHTSEQVVKQNTVLVIAARDSHMEVVPSGFATTQPGRVTPGLQLVAKTESTVDPPPPPKLIVHFSRCRNQLKVPEGVAEDEWIAFQYARPAPDSKVCLCNKSAGYTVKKKEDPQIAQCNNKECRFRWFHYACLNLSEKGKARFGTLLCPFCRLEQDSVERDRKNGWSAETLRNFEPVLKKEQVKVQFPGPGGVVAIANPYGLGLGLQPGPKYNMKTMETGALGELDRLGYSQSHPEVLEEAYLHAGAYAELLARRGEDDEGDRREVKFGAGGYVDE